ncbi:MAG: 6-pyruvoyl-tetrahydropterin synthase-related protein, partial [Microgenomates group bacterium]
MKTKLLALVIALLLILPTFIFFLGDKMFTFHDETQIANLHQYFKSLDFGQFPPRWAPDMHFEYGSPFLSFNYQLPYYLGYLGHLAGLPLTAIFKFLMAFSVIIGAIGMFRLAVFLTGSNFVALFAAVLYSYTPFQAVDHYVRGTLGESFALALFPWLFLSLFALTKKVTTTKIIFAGLLFGLLLTTHQPAALFALPLFFTIFALPALFTKQFGILIALAKALVLASLFSAFYVLPVLFEKQFIVANSPFNFQDHFPFIRQLIYSSWSYSGSNPFSTDTMSFQIGLVNLAILAAAVVF